MNRLARISSILLALCVLAVVLVIGGAGGLLYSSLLLAVAVPGLPLGFALFGRRHAAGWIAGLLFGYALTALAWWAVRYLHVVSGPALVSSWALVFAASWAVAARVQPPAVPLPTWTRRDTGALALTLLLVPALVAVPFARLGSTDATGARQYRAYFIADFTWHTALVAELAKEASPPRNPYLAAEPMHYYWTYFVVPAELSSRIGTPVEKALELNAVGAALLLIAAIFLAAWTAMPDRTLTVAVAVAMTVLAASAEGLAATVDLLRRGHSLSELRNLNIDAIASWAFKGLRIDDLPRAMWYTPQHSMAYALGLIAIPVLIAGGLRARVAAILLAGTALGASFAFDPLVGAFFSLLYGTVIVVEAARTRGSLRDVLRHALAAVPVFAAFAWSLLNDVAGGAAGALHFGIFGPGAHAPLVTFLLSFGPLLIPLALGLWPSRGRAFGPFLPALLGLVLSVLLMHFVTLTTDVFWVGFRGGHLFFVLAPALVALGLARLWRPGLEPAAIGLAAVVFAAGLPTTVIDAYNAQDVENRSMGPGFHWTVVVTPAEQEALAWIRTHTAPDAIVQDEPVVRGRETWSLIPSLAQRRMAAGNGLPLPGPDYAAKSAEVRGIFASTDAKAAWRIATALGIDYLYVGIPERTAYPAGVAKFDSDSKCFRPVFRNAEAAVYAVNRRAGG
ncbi:MAG: hypothetical protein ACM3SQ_16105 [Betaproteobacteria bacterium]